MKNGFENLDNPENHEAGKLEWAESPKMLMNFEGAQQEITKMNSELKEGEKRWRLPTKEELQQAGDLDDNIPGFTYQGQYWSSTPSERHPKTMGIYIIMPSGASYEANKYAEYKSVRLVREK